MTFSDIIAIVALVTSIGAMVIAILQALQQYVSSAEGYRRCADSVMGPWSTGTRRRFLAAELRFEVIFETPVIFLAPPTNTRGPIPKRKIHYLDGTPESYQKTRVLEPEEQKTVDEKALARVHTADDEKASWVILLSSLQLEERNSRSWDVKNHTTARGKKHPEPTYTLAVGLQSKKRSWDFMPDSVTKPYATSTISHVIEMVALLGMYWKSFDQMTWNVRAEGNGFIVTSTEVRNLGMMLNFSITGRSNFEETRVIPNDNIKELCFGSVPTIFENLKTEKQAPHSINLGSRETTTLTLETLGVSSENMAKYEKRHKHLFSLSFEIAAMLGITIRIRGSNFKRIPNPTTDHWIQSKFTKIDLLSRFISNLSLLAKKYESPLPRLSKIFEHWGSIEPVWCDSDDSIDIDLREALHDALDESNEYLLSHTASIVIGVVASHLNTVIEKLEDLESFVSGISKKKEDFLMNYYITTVLPTVCENMQKQDDTGAHMGELAVDVTSIWVTLVFRMLLWLLLHDFDKADVIIVPTDLKGSRMPVYFG